MQINQCPRCSVRFRGELERCPIDGQPLQPVDDPLIGRTIAGRYLVEERVGSGGMGTVYRGRHQVIDRDVAVKFLHPRFTKDAKQRKRFLGEARAANQINHEHIIDITDFGETDDGYVYLVMEFLEGRSLSNEVSQGPLPIPRALFIGMQIAAGLARAHELDVIHRDVKPGNIFLIRRRRTADFVKLLDFGIARFEREMRITGHGQLLGTPEYMAPEQMRQGEAGPASDLYGLGCVLYEMFCGHTPFRGSMAAVLVKQVSEAPRPLSELVRDLPPRVGAMVARLLSKNPAQRHRDAHHLVDELRELYQATPGAMPLDGLGTDPPPSIVASTSPGQEPAHTGQGLGPRSAVVRESLPADRPTMCAETGEDGWRERLEDLRNTLTEKHPGGIPPDMQQALDRMDALLAEAAKMRVELAGVAQEATSQASEVSGVRASIGHALDELATDESKVARALAQLRRQLDAAYQAMEGCAEHLCELAGGSMRMPETGHLMAASAVQDVKELARRVAIFSKARGEVARIKGHVEQNHNTWEDLSFQMQQLKGRLGTLNASSGADLDAASSRTNELDATLRKRLDELLPASELIATHLKAI